MPCRCDDYEPQNSKSIADKYKQQRDQYKKEADKATRLLCAALRSIEARQDFVVDFVSQETVEWWEAHQDEDEKRIQAEEKAARRKKKKAESARRKADLKKKALDKLTKAEKAVLGFID